MKINLGCGWRNFGDDWIHIDGGDYSHLDHNSITNFPYKNIDLIYASHVIEYFDREEVVEHMKYWKSKLKIGGVFRVAVPDFRAMASLYVQNKYPLENFIGPMYGKMRMKDETIYHKTVYDEESLRALFKSVGYTNIRLWDHTKVEHSIYDDFSQSYLPHMDKENGVLISLNMEGVNE